MKIVVAVSGGVDSVVMLHKLIAEAEHKLIVAHYDHAMREDSVHDAAFVEGLTEKHKLELYIERAKVNLSSETRARMARWKFLRTVLKKTNADMIATAHHEDDMIETMIINLHRGTGRSGLASLTDTEETIRPLLNMTKAEIYDYALKHNLEWVEDEMNKSDDYLRNRIRHNVLPKLNYFERDQLLRIQAKARTNNQYLETLLDKFVSKNFHVKNSSHTGKRSEFVSWPYSLRKEVVRYIWLQLKFEEIDARDIERIAVAIATSRSDSAIDGSKNVKLDVGRTKFTLYYKE